MQTSLKMLTPTIFAFVVILLTSGIGNAVKAQVTVPWGEIAKILPERPENWDRFGGRFGGSVAIEGNFAVIGASGIDSDSSNGLAYVLFYDSTIGWETIAQLTVSQGYYNGILFGSAVGISGDYIVVGSPEASHQAQRSGAAYVFSKPTTGWKSMTETAKLNASDFTSGYRFGSSVSISKDLIVVGDRNTDDLVVGGNVGSVYLFSKPDSGWISMSETGKLLASDASSRDLFGRSVSISGEHIVVGATGGGDNGIETGAAYVFSKPNTGWDAIITETAKLLAYDVGLYDRFGMSVSISGDNIVVGAEYDDDNGQYSGSAYVFVKPTNGWVSMTETAKLIPVDGNFGDFFGGSVSISGDNIVVGAWGNNIFGQDAGAVYVFSKPGSSWIPMSETLRLYSSEATAGHWLGMSVGISGNNIVAGAPGDDEIAQNAGSAYFFQEGNFVPTDKPKLGRSIRPINTYLINGSLVIEMMPPVSNYKIEIFDLLGKLVYSDDMTTNIKTINIDDLIGVHHIKISNGTEFLKVERMVF